MTADEELRRAAESVIALWDTVSVREQEFVDGIAALRAALAARSEPDPAECGICGDYTAGGVEVHEACLVARSEPHGKSTANDDRVSRSEPRAEGLIGACERLMAAFDWTRAGAWVGLSEAEWVAVYNAIRDIREALAATPPAEGLVPRDIAEAALTDFIYAHGSDFDWFEYPGMAALRAALAPEQPE